MGVQEIAGGRHPMAHGVRAVTRGRRPAPGVRHGARRGYRAAMSISLEQAQSIVSAALAHARAQGFKPLTVAVLDPGGALVALGREDGSGFLRPGHRDGEGLRRARAGDGQPGDRGARRGLGGVLHLGRRALGRQGVLGARRGVHPRRRRDAARRGGRERRRLDPADEEAVVAGIRAAGLPPRTGAE